MRERERDRERENTQAGERERVHEKELWLLLLCFFPPPGPALCKLDLAGVLFVLPEVFILVLGPSFDLPCLLATAIWTPFPCSTYLTLPTIPSSKMMDKIAKSRVEEEEVKQIPQLLLTTPYHKGKAGN